MENVLDFLLSEYELPKSALDVFVLTFALLAGCTIFDIITQTFTAIYYLIGGKKR